MFFALVIAFSGFIILAGKMDPECVRIGGEEVCFEDKESSAWWLFSWFCSFVCLLARKTHKCDRSAAAHTQFDYSDTAFANAFALSWTTFSTVGYGSTSPALSHQNDNPTNCFFINFICSIESLMGVLYSGFCGAILFGKVLRIQSHAQVIFSDPIVIRYGSGVSKENEYNSDDGSSTGGGGAGGDKGSPCPVLEFRIVNRLFGETGGEIMDATLNVVANVDANDSDLSQRGDGLSSRSRQDSTVSNDSASDNGSSANTSDMHRSADSSRHHSLERFLDPLRQLTRRDQQRIVEDPSSRLVSKQIFSKMTIEAGDHPFFKRVWLARHELDEFSPILKPRVRRQIKRNGGRWPERLNSHNAIRDSLQFNQILVSLNGVSNVSASEVYAQRIYDFVDINVGYQFVNLLYRDADGTLGVDLDLINDVREQNGGGGEPLLLN